MLDLALVGLGVLQALLWLCLTYHYGLLLASIRQPRVPSRSGPPVTRFAIAIPAHNEAAVIARTVAQLQRQAYPVGLYEIHIVADHCTDTTADCARQAGAEVHVRDSLPRGRKAYALSWLLDRILSEDPAPDAVAVFDADSLVDPGFLAAMDRSLRGGRRVLQGQHIISNPGDGLFPAMAAVDMRLNNRLRNQSRANLGFSCRLMGDGMVFDAGLLRTHGWLGQSLSEDRETGYELLLRGVKVHYVPEARSYGQAAGSWKDAEEQRLRWYGGVAGTRRRLAARLVAGALRFRSLLLLDAFLELVLPSYSLLTALAVLCLVLTAGLYLMRTEPSPWMGIGAAVLLAGWVLYPWLGLAVDRAPGWAYRTLLAGPAYLLWRLWISLLVRLRGGRVAWVRTRRREEGGKRGPI